MARVGRLDVLTVPKIKNQTLTTLAMQVEHIATNITSALGQCECDSECDNPNVSLMDCGRLLEIAEQSNALELLFANLKPWMGD